MERSVAQCRCLIFREVRTAVIDSATARKCGVISVHVLLRSLHFDPGTMLSATGLTLAEMDAKHWECFLFQAADFLPRDQWRQLGERVSGREREAVGCASGEGIDHVRLPYSYGPNPKGVPHDASAAALDDEK